MRCDYPTQNATHLLTHTLHPGSLTGLASQTTARQGNVLGILGVGSGILASLAAVGFPTETLIQFAGVSAIGGLIGTVIGRRVTATELPQMVAALHSVVGLAAVLTSVGSVLGGVMVVGGGDGLGGVVEGVLSAGAAAVGHVGMLHLVTAYLGVLIGEC